MSVFFTSFCKVMINIKRTIYNDYKLTMDHPKMVMLNSLSEEWCPNIQYLHQL